jgi:hypothetical protein
LFSLADFDEISTPIGLLYDQFAQVVLNDIARRLAKMGYSSAAWQVERLIESGKTYAFVIRELAKMTGQSERTLRQTFKEWGVKSVAFDNRILVEAGVLPAETASFSDAMLRILAAGVRRTEGVLRNITLTTANTAQSAFIDAADMAYTLVAHGTMSYTQAIRMAISAAAKRGVQVIEYPSGRKNQLDVAVRRTVLTGVAQTTGEIQMDNIKNLGVDLIGVSAHIGARNKGGIPENHELWQGQVYSLTGSGGYKDFYTYTGYGTGPGLCGWNCRHSFYPYFEGVAERYYTPKVLDEFKSKTVTYRGKEMSLYEGTQMQRKIERGIRAAKREAEAVGAAGLNNREELVKVRRLQARMRDFISQTGLQRQPEREGPRVRLVE